VTIVAVAAVAGVGGVTAATFMFLSKMQIINKKINPRKIRIFTRL
jgi:hypothetical protein